MKGRLCRPLSFGLTNKTWCRQVLSTIPNGPHPEEAALLRGRLEGWTQAPTRSILRDASLRDAPQEEAGVWCPPQLPSGETRRRGECLGFCCRSRNHLVPTAGRRLDGGRFIGLRHSRKSFCVQFGAFQLLRVKPRGDLVALASGVLIAAFCRQREPRIRFGEVALDAGAARIQDREIVLAIDDAMRSGPAEPLRRGRIVRPAIEACGIEYGEIMHRPGMPLVGSPHIA